MDSEEHIDLDLYGRGFDGIFGKGAEAQNRREALLRQKAIRDFHANIKPGEFIELDLYGRGDPRVFGANAHLEVERNAAETLAANQTSRKNRKVKLRAVMFPVGLKAKAKSLVRRLSPMKRESADNNTENLTSESDEEEEVAVDDTPRRFKSKLPSEEAMPPIEKGIVARVVRSLTSRDSNGPLSSSSSLQKKVTEAKEQHGSGEIVGVTSHGILDSSSAEASEIESSEVDSPETSSSTVVSSESEPENSASASSDAHTQENSACQDTISRSEQGRSVTPVLTEGAASLKLKGSDGIEKLKSILETSDDDKTLSYSGSARAQDSDLPPQNSSSSQETPKRYEESGGGEQNVAKKDYYARHKKPFDINSGRARRLLGLFASDEEKEVPSSSGTTNKSGSVSFSRTNSTSIGGGLREGSDEIMENTTEQQFSDNGTVFGLHEEKASELGSKERSESTLVLQETMVEIERSISRTARLDKTPSKVVDSSKVVANQVPTNDAAEREIMDLQSSRSGEDMARDGDQDARSDQHPGADSDEILVDSDDSGAASASSEVVSSSSDEAGEDSDEIEIDSQFEVESSTHSGSAAYESIADEDDFAARVLLQIAHSEDEVKRSLMEQPAIAAASSMGLSTSVHRVSSLETDIEETEEVEVSGSDSGSEDVFHDSINRILEPHETRDV